MPNDGGTDDGIQESPNYERWLDIQARGMSSWIVNQSPQWKVAQLEQGGKSAKCTLTFYSRSEGTTFD